MTQPVRPRRWSLVVAWLLHLTALLPYWLTTLVAPMYAFWLLLVAEEPGVGLGARYAGLEDLDPGLTVAGQPDAKVEAAGHPTALWRSRSADDRAAFVGEAMGVWLWAVLWPPAAELVLLEHVELHDVRHDAHAALDLPVGAPTTRLA